MAGEHPNYHQLLYFWAVVREGGVVRAAEVLHVTPQTISGQLKLLQTSINSKLLVRHGRGLEPTDLGRSVFRMAEEMFARGLEIAEFMRSGSPRGPFQLIVGIADSVMEATVCDCLAPAFTTTPGTRLVCREGPLEALLSDLGAHRLDVVLSPSALPSSSSLRGTTHLLAECETLFLAAPAVLRQLKGRFPDNLDRAPWLLPFPGTAVRRALDGWFGRRGIVPTIVGEFDGAHIMRAFAARGAGIICAPVQIRTELEREYGLVVLGSSADLPTRVYAIVLERRVQLPALRAVLARAQSRRE